LFGLSGDPLYNVAANLGPDLDRIIAQVRRLVDRCAPAATEAIYDFIQNRPDRVGNLISGRRRSDGSTPASASSNSGEFLFNGA
jgi:hypothetical protein